MGLLLSSIRTWRMRANKLSQIIGAEQTSFDICSIMTFERTLPNANEGIRHRSFPFAVPSTYTHFRRMNAFVRYICIRLNVAIPHGYRIVGWSQSSCTVVHYNNLMTAIFGASAPLLENVDTCAYWLFCTTFNAQQLLFEELFEIMLISGSVKLLSESLSPFK